MKRPPRLILRAVAPAMRAVGLAHAAGLRVGAGPLHRLAALHRRLRRLLWPMLVRKTPFTRVARIDADGGTLAGFAGAAAITAPWSVVIRDGPGRHFVDRTYDFVRGRLDLQGAFVATFGPAYLHVPSGLVCTADGAVIADSAKKVERHIDAAIGVDLRAARRLAGTWTTVMCRPHDNYYHWFNDCVLRLYLLERRPDPAPLTIAVPPTLRPYQRQSLLDCLPHGAGLDAVGDEWVQVERLILPSFITEPLVGMAPPEALAWVRDRVVSRVFGGPPPPSRRRLYISRAGTGHRQVINEADLTDSLRDCGFDIVTPETLSFDDQVRLFATADVIVGARGAALTNMLFAARAKVLEITADVPFAGAVYFSMAYSLGHEHHHLFCQHRGRSYLVDPAAFRRAVHALVAA